MNPFAIGVVTSIALFLCFYENFRRRRMRFGDQSMSDGWGGGRGGGGGGGRGWKAGGGREEE